MPHHFPLSPIVHLSTGQGTAGSSGHAEAGTPRTTLFALTPLSVPDGFGPGQTVTHWPVRSSTQAGWDAESQRPHAVILDQDPNVLEVLGQLLNDEDYDVTLSAQFLDKENLERLEPDVVVADAAFTHGPDGQGLYDEPLQRVDGTTIPVVYSTTLPDVAAELMEREIPTLLKPFDLDTFLALVCRDANPDT